MFLRLRWSPHVVPPSTVTVFFCVCVKAAVYLFEQKIWLYESMSPTNKPAIISVFRAGPQSKTCRTTAREATA